MRKILYGAIGSIAMLPIFSFAQVYSTTTAAAQINSVASDFGYLIGVSLVVTLAGAAALIGLGFAWRHLKKYVTGKKF